MTCPICKGTRQAFPVEYDVVNQMEVTIHADNGCKCIAYVTLEQAWQKIVEQHRAPVSDSENLLRTLLLVLVAAAEDAALDDINSIPHADMRLRIDKLPPLPLAPRTAPAGQGELL